jgi:hypothetical protein
MNKNESLIPIAFIGLSLLFIIFSAMVFLTNGRSKKWVAWKILIGCLMLLFSTVLNSCFRTQSVLLECALSSEKIDTYISYGPTIYLTEGNQIKGRIFYPQHGCSFLLKDSIGTSIQMGRLIKGYNLNDITGDFEIVLDNKLNPGKYELSIYSYPAEIQTAQKPDGTINVIMK